jgi:hypothetical protein
VRTGLEHGFDSAPFMAHVYSDEPAGALGLGRRIDRRLLGSLTCRSFREVSRLAADALRELLDERAGRGTFVVDLAAGPARALLDVLAERPRPEVRTLLRDVDGSALARARTEAAARGVAGVETAVGDALDPASLATIAPRPDIAVELGFYGMFDDDVIAAHLRDLGRVLRRARWSRACRCTIRRSTTSPGSGPAGPAGAAGGACARRGSFSPGPGRPASRRPGSAGRRGASTA